MGRPRKAQALSTGKIGIEKIARKREQEAKLKLGREDLLPPSWLNAAGKKEFNRVVEATAKIGILDDLDLSTLAVYAQAYTDYIEVTKLLKKVGKFYTKEDGQGNTIPCVHPAVNTQEKYAKTIFQCSTKLGLATTDRLKLVVPEAETPKANKYLEIINIGRKQA